MNKMKSGKYSIKKKEGIVGLKFKNQINAITSKFILGKVLTNLEKKIKFNIVKYNKNI